MRRAFVVTTLLVVGIVGCSSAIESRDSERTGATIQALEDTDQDQPSGPPPVSGGNHAAGDIPNGPPPGGCTTCGGDPPQEVTVHGEPRHPPQNPGGSAGSEPGTGEGSDPNMPLRRCGTPGAEPCPNKKGCFDADGNLVSENECPPGSCLDENGKLATGENCPDERKVCIRVSNGECFPDLKWNWTNTCIYACKMKIGVYEQVTKEKQACKQVERGFPKGTYTWTSQCPPTIDNPWAF